MCEESVGDAGASSLGYYGGCFSPDGRSLVAHGFTGALHLWHREGKADHPFSERSSVHIASDTFDMAAGETRHCQAMSWELSVREGLCVEASKLQCEGLHVGVLQVMEGGLVGCRSMRWGVIMAQWWTSPGELMRPACRASAKTKHPAYSPSAAATGVRLPDRRCALTCILQANYADCAFSKCSQMDLGQPSPLALL